MGQYCWSLWRPTGKEDISCVVVRAAAAAHGGGSVLVRVRAPSSGGGRTAAAYHQAVAWPRAASASSSGENRILLPQSSRESSSLLFLVDRSLCERGAGRSHPDPGCVGYWEGDYHLSEEGAWRFHPNRGWGLGGEFSSLGGKRWRGVSPLAFGRAAALPCPLDPPLLLILQILVKY
jgi:hypothetical protein